MIEKVVEQLLEGAYTNETSAAIVSRASWDDEHIRQGTLGDIAAKVKEAGIDRQALIVWGMCWLRVAKGSRPSHCSTTVNLPTDTAGSSSDMAIVIIAITHNGARLGKKLLQGLAGAELSFPAAMPDRPGQRPDISTLPASSN
jgi:hypothetical protein